ncbi:MAG: PorP/SprF family type IX secretion system membrane protein, partial [Bacteroidota bacterium]
SSSVRFSGGVGAIIESTKLSIGEITVRDPDPYYDRLLQSATSQTNLNVRAGALVYSNRFYFGVSYLPIVNSVIQSAEVALEEPFYRGSVQAGYSFAINPDLVLKPSVLGLLHMNNEFSIDYGVKGYIQEKIWFGLTYRDIQSGIGIVGFNINETFTASYSYEMSLGDFKQFSDGSHELVLAIRVKNFRRQSQYTW